MNPFSTDGQQADSLLAMTQAGSGSESNSEGAKIFKLKLLKHYVKNFSRVPQT